MLLCLVELLTFSLSVGIKSLYLLSIAGNALLTRWLLEGYIQSLLYDLTPNTVSRTIVLYRLLRSL